MKKIRCAKCLKRPDEIDEYIDVAREEETTPEEYVVANEGTFDHKSQMFLCTDCYMAVGQPSAPSPGWTATIPNLWDLGLPDYSKHRHIFDEEEIG